jgi:hypothetical protein
VLNRHSLYRRGIAPKVTEGKSEQGKFGRA